MLEVLVEEPSMRVVVEAVLPDIVDEVPFAVRTFNGKDDLLRQLRDRLQGYAAWAQAAGLGVIVLVDRDSDDCRRLKQRLAAVAPAGAALSVFSAARPNAGGRVLPRVVCEELEAWFLGDIPALRAAYPRVPASVAERARFRDPDGVRGGTWEALEGLLQQAGYHAGGLPKYECAKAVAPHLNVEENRSVSFRHFRDGVRRLVGRAA